ncbi:MAG: hypothetical protein WCA20_09240 [Candidatus Sulfotelmatobacter sp.]
MRIFSAAGSGNLGHGHGQFAGEQPGGERFAHFAANLLLDGTAGLGFLTLAAVQPGADPAQQALEVFAFPVYLNFVVSVAEDIEKTMVRERWRMHSSPYATRVVLGQRARARGSSSRWPAHGTVARDHLRKKPHDGLWDSSVFPQREQ